MKTRVLIVDDEPLARDVVRHCVGRHADAEVVGECGSGDEALRFLRGQPVDVLFLDVQMPEMDGFQLLAQLPAEAMPVVVFVTAHDRYAMRAFEAHAVEYLLKPFDQERFDRAFDRARQMVDQLHVGHAQRELRALLQSLAGGSQATPRVERLTVKDGDKIVLVRVADLVSVCAEGDYVLLQTGSRRYVMHETLSRLAEQLDARQFVRIHRSAIVNLERVRELEPYFNGEYHVVMQDGSRLKLSRTYRQNLLDALGTEAL